MKLLVIPDIHENLDILKYIMAVEDTGKFDHIILLGNNLEVPQIAGHTRCAKQTQKGRSYCIDMVQAAYAVIEDGDMQLRIWPNSWLGESLLESV